jgi:hypothetical protein
LREECHVEAVVKEEVVARVARAESFLTYNSTSDGSRELEVHSHLAAVGEGCLAKKLS